MSADVTENIYLVVPKEYRCTYNRLLTALSDFGIDALKDCASACKGDNAKIIKCWNMFQSAIAAYTIGNTKEADVIIKYIDAQLNTIYKNKSEDSDCKDITCCDYELILELLKKDFKDIVIEALEEYFGAGPTPTTKYTVTVNTVPSNATVSINGQTTKTLEVPAGSRVTIITSLTGYVTDTNVIESIDSDKNITVILTPVSTRKYTVTVIPTPSDANVKINNLSLKTLEVDEGSTVNIEVSKSGYITANRTITNISHSQEIYVSLEEETPVEQPEYIIAVEDPLGVIRYDGFTIVVPAAGQTYTLPYISKMSYQGIDTNLDLRVGNMNYEWFTAEIVDNDIVITVQANSDVDGRAGTFTVFQYNGEEETGKNLGIMIQQLGTTVQEDSLVVKHGGEAFSPDGTLTQLIYDSNGGTKTIDIESNTNWNIT